MAIRATLECGHSSVLRARITPEGYTHDWEVFVRGVNNADIHHFIEKVVFHLHATFPKPKRTIKSPPYVVKESGYAGFVIPIHIYLRNKDEPKKFIIHYDLQLQQSGPAINSVIIHNEIFVSPSDEFRKLLLKGGATLVHNSEGSADKFDSNKLAVPLTGKPKLSGSETKKHRPVEPKPVNTFAALFGTPIKTGKISPDNNKKVLSGEKSVTGKPAVPEKNDKLDRNQKTKHSQHKETVKDKTNEERKDKKDKEKESTKDKDKSKEKYKRSLSPTNKNNHLSPKMKRTVSPSPVRKPKSPSSVTAKRSLSPKPRDKEAKKEAEKEREKEKTTKEVPRTSSEDSKSDRKKDKKRHKEDREKEKKDNHKEKDRDRSKDSSKNDPSSKKLLDKSAEKQDKARLEKNVEMKAAVKEEKKSPKMKEYEKPKEDKLQVKAEKAEKADKTDKKETKSGEKERQQKHKHKKKDKKEKRDGSKDRERKEKRERSKGGEKASSGSNALSTLLAEMPGDDTDSHSGEEEVMVDSKLVKKELEEPAPPEPARTSEEFSAEFAKREKGERHKRDKSSKLSRSEERESRRKKKRSEAKQEDESAAREVKRERVNSTSPALEPVSSSQSPVVTEADRTKESYKEHTSQKGASERDQEQVTPDSTNSALVEAEVVDKEDEYMTMLKEMQYRINTSQDNDELQKIVDIIEETGMYDITKKTFDFDLNHLDRRTIERLRKLLFES